MIRAITKKFHMSEKLESWPELKYISIIYQMFCSRRPSAHFVTKAYCIQGKAIQGKIGRRVSDTLGLSLALNPTVVCIKEGCPPTQS